MFIMHANDINIIHTESDWTIFDCRKCGRCCKEIGLPYDPRFVRRLANNYESSFEKIIERYYGRWINDNKWTSMEEKRTPCPFLKENKRCKIYSIRPDSCRAYPLDTDFGRQEVNCPAYKEFYLESFVRDALEENELYFLEMKEKYDEMYGLEFCKKVLSKIDNKLCRLKKENRQTPKLNELYDDISSMLDELSSKYVLNDYYRYEFRHEIENKIEYFFEILNI